MRASEYKKKRLSLGVTESNFIVCSSLYCITTKYEVLDAVTKVFKKSWNYFWDKRFYIFSVNDVRV